MAANDTLPKLVFSSSEDEDGEGDKDIHGSVPIKGPVVTSEVPSSDPDEFAMSPVFLPKDMNQTAYTGISNDILPDCLGCQIRKPPEQKIDSERQSNIQKQDELLKTPEKSAAVVSPTSLPGFTINLSSAELLSGLETKQMLLTSYLSRGTNAVLEEEKDSISRQIQDINALLSKVASAQKEEKSKLINCKMLYLSQSESSQSKSEEIKQAAKQFLGEQKRLLEAFKKQKTLIGNWSKLKKTSLSLNDTDGHPPDMQNLDHSYSCKEPVDSERLPSHNPVMSKPQLRVSPASAEMVKNHVSLPGSCCLDNGIVDVDSFLISEKSSGGQCDSSYADKSGNQVDLEVTQRGSLKLNHALQPFSEDEGNETQLPSDCISSPNSQATQETLLNVDTPAITGDNVENRESVPKGLACGVDNEENILTASSQEICAKRGPFIGRSQSLSKATDSCILKAMTGTGSEDFLVCHEMSLVSKTSATVPPCNTYLQSCSRIFTDTGILDKSDESLVEDKSKVSDNSHCVVSSQVVQNNEVSICMNSKDRLSETVILAKQLSNTSIAEGQSGSGAVHLPKLKKRYHTLRGLVEDDILTPGTNVLTLMCKGTLLFGTLTPDGKIRTESGETYLSAEHWIFAARKMKFTRQSAWKMVRYKGRPLSSLTACINQDTTDANVDQQTERSEENGSSLPEITRPDATDAVATSRSDGERGIEVLLIQQEELCISSTFLPDEFWTVGDLSEIDISDTFLKRVGFA